MCAAKKVESNGFRLDVCQVGQSELAKYFSRPGYCFGDLRRRLVVKHGMQAAIKETSDDVWWEEDRRFVESLERQERGEAADGDWIDEYLMRSDLEERYPEGDTPCFCGGTLEKKSEVTRTYRRQKRNDRANNDRRHGMHKPRHESVRYWAPINQQRLDKLFRLLRKQRLDRFR